MDPGRRALATVAIACLLSGAAAAQSSPPTVTVNGRLLSGPGAFAELRQGRLYVPVVAIAQALGDQVTVDPAARIVRVRRRTGVEAELRALTGEVLENGVPILVVPPAAEVVFPLDPSALQLPAELVSPLLGVELVTDAAGQTVRVTRDLERVAIAEGAERGLFDVYQGRYAYNASATPSSFNHNFNLSGTGRAHDGLVSLTANFAGSAREGLFDFRHGLLTYDRPNGQRLMLGDVSSGGDLTLLQAALRGGWYRQRLGAIDVTAFGGLARSGELPDPLSGVRPELNFDTSVIATYFTLGRERPQGAEQHLTSSTGGMWFNGPRRRAGLASTALTYQTTLHTFRVDLGFGTFEQLRDDGTYVRGEGLLIDTSESITPTDALTLVAGFTHVPETFVAPQAGTYLRPMNLLSGGVNWRITPWLTTSVAGRHVERLDRPDRAVDYDVTGALAFAPGGYWPSLSLSHSEGVQTEFGGRAFTLLNVVKAWEGFDAFANLTRNRLGSAPAQLNLTVGAGALVPRIGNVRAYQSFSSLGALSGGVDVTVPAFFTDKVTAGAGAGYTWDGTSLQPSGRLLVSARLPASQLLTLNVTQSQFGAAAFVELSGPLFERPGAAAQSRMRVEELSNIGSFSGRVYQDVDLDGRFDPAVDRALPGVRVLVDGNNAVVTDDEGAYRLRNVQAGMHRIYVDLLTVRADLSLLSGGSREVMLLPEREVSVDFQLVRTGRVSGYVWLDADEDGEYDETEELLGDVRIVSGNRDTLTSPSGDFVIGDLPQGRHTLLIDEKTLPEGMRSSGGPVEITITPPRETRGVKLPVRKKPVELEIKEF